MKVVPKMKRQFSKDAKAFRIAFDLAFWFFKEDPHSHF
ncbi:hypothetical protein LEP1GSC037_2753 [Leptospira interrogans str. 2006001854]|uniref:Uncharacterized protein n=1 Tax=Leptospira interrogans str. 2006001854 TaxID=1001590 RepID=M6GKZ2_LEPIR|nr:hypothetical protein LEP1GSC037_2753 [Leptospira interrogans str. 2006001854]